MWHWFVVEKKQKVNWKKGFPCTTMKGKWKDLLYILQMFLTYEDHYLLTFLYHSRLLLHFELGKLINFPYLSAKKFEENVKRSAEK